ncbi:MAG: tRNA (adenosine(37)-N6)-threonylcarbamoyltransferase complex ATPase subunit type 1 TsaE [Alphaproteobacteria bacterium]|nr:tRNA (adenosine(37)-N6)-threonylcarbamoyltransferase complex ATPase subunit type 1 TsaE [Alphaproteobacteria bacterium]
MENNNFEFVVDEQGLENLAKKLAPQLNTGDCILLDGTLGMGKTVFSRAFVRALTSNETEVPSPTFTLVQVYDTDKTTIWHFDLYRIKSPDEIYEIGFEEALATGISLIEWPERAKGMYPKNAITVHFEQGPEQNLRKITIDFPKDLRKSNNLCL